MVPIKMLITNFKGLRGKRTVEFSPLMAYCLPNAAGKTSLFDAFRWGLTGLEPEGGIVTKGEPGCRVDIIWEDGSVTSRRRSLEKGALSCYVNGTKTSMRDMNAFIAGLVGVDTDSLRLSTSQEVLAGLSPDRFSEFILSKIRLAMTAEQVAADAGAEGRMKEIVTGYFGEGTFGQKELDGFLDHCTEKRIEWKRKAQEAKASLAFLGKMKEPARSLEAVLEEKKKLNERLEAFHKWNADSRAYRTAQAEARKRDDMMRALKEKIDAITAREPVAGEREKLLAYKKRTQALIRTEIEGIAETNAEIVSKKKEIRRLTSEHCVASSRILCTTDRSCAKKDLHNEIRELQENVKEGMKRKEAVEQKLTKIERAIEEVLENEALWKRRKDLEEQASLLLEMSITVPEEPVEVSDPRDEIRRCEDEILACREWLRAEKGAEGVKEAQEEYEAYDRLVKACGPKGTVREALLVRFLGTLADAANAKADLIHEGMRIAFVTERGIVPVLDPDGSGNYLHYEELSGGQKVMLLYLVMDLIRQMTGVRILMLDETGVLDDESLSALMLLIASSSDFEMIMLATAYHRSTAEIIEHFGIRTLMIPEAETH